MDAALGVGPGGDDGSVPGLGQGGGQGENLAFQVIVVLETVIAPGGIEHPVADVDQIQQTAELFWSQFDVHGRPSFMLIGSIIAPIF